MIKQIVLLFNLVGILSISSIFTNEVKIRTNIPAEVDAGGNFTIEVIITKGDLDKFARFKMDLPAGFKATPKSTANGEFSFNNQSVVFFWIRLPYEEEFSISFNVDVAPTANGEFNLQGSFSYIQDNKRETFNMAPQSITVKSSEYANAAQDEEAITFTYGNITEKGISCIRQKPYLSDNDEVIVNLLVNKGDINKFGKITEVVPIGYKAENVKGKNSVFTFKNNEVKFSWLDLPSDPQFVVTYKLIPEGKINDQAFIITGTFSYIGNDQLKEVDVVERGNIDLENFQPGGLVAENIAKPIEEVVKPAEKTEPETNNIVETTANENNVVEEFIKPEQTNKQETKVEKQEKLAENIKEKTKQIEETKQAEKTKQIEENKISDVIAGYTEKNNEPSLVSIPNPETGISYRVQVAAGHKMVKPAYFKKLNIKDEVRVEIHEGWHKYTIGSFKIYRDARDYRIHIWNTTPVDDAFVAAYNFGNRITVQEALMIASQKWYK
ncbi:MAG: hypothetical protein GXO79_04500 [Chlorobi bacterium]|nr:hypothetical protein [Chlorobiota bacterium]